MVESAPCAGWRQQPRWSRFPARLTSAKLRCASAPTSTSAVTGMGKRAALLFLTLAVIATDVITKRWALHRLSDGTSLELLGGLVPITLAFNRGAAFGLTIGNDPRWFFIPVTVIAIVFLVLLIRQAGPTEPGRAAAGALVLGGAFGNLFDRVRWDRGVVDFIGPIDLGFMDWPIFNVADMGITCGAILLAISFFGEDSRNREEPEVDLYEGGSGPDPEAEP